MISASLKGAQPRRPYRRLPILIILIVAGMIGIGAAAFLDSKTRMLATTGQALALTAANVTNTLDLVLSERYGDAGILAGAFRADMKDRRHLTDRLLQTKRSYTLYRWLGVADAQGIIIAATDPATVGHTIGRLSSFLSARETGTIHVGDVAPDTTIDGMAMLSFTAPILSSNGTFQGVVTMRVGVTAIEDIVARGVQTFRERRGFFGGTEFQIMNRQGGAFIDSDLPHKGNVNLLASGLPSARASRAQQAGYLEEEHARRHVPVITGYSRMSGRHAFPDMGWVVLIRADREDALRPILHTLWSLVLLGAATLMPLFGLLYWSTTRLRTECTLARLESTRARMAEDVMRKNDTMTRLLVDTALDAVVTTDAHGAITNWNVQAEPMFGWRSEEAIGRRLSSLIMTGDFAEAYERGHRNFLATGQWPELNKRIETRVRHRNGHEISAEITIAPIPFGDSYMFSAFIRDITERKRTEQYIQHMAQHDTLTDLPNRTMLRDRLEQAMSHARRRGAMVALLFLDLDRFKVVNDSLGHDTGDLLLKAAAERLQRCVRGEDTVARHGGDEFTIILADLQNVQGAIRVAEQVLGAFTQPIRIQDRDVYTTASVGIAMFPADADDSDSLLKHADIAMYKAKREGGNSCQFFTADLHAAVQERLQMEHRLRLAVSRREFVLHYQPVFDVTSKTFAKVEALIRWQPPGESMVSPIRFIPVAEETGLIVPIGEWVLRTACAQVKAWHDEGWPGMRVAVNLSARQFVERDITASLSAILRDTGLPPACLELELTESIFLKDAEATIATLRSMKELGVKLAIDDFGTGYSSLSYLRKFPIDTLKIDQSFIRDLANDPDDASIVKTILAMAKTLKMDAIAEGVELETQLEFLRTNECKTAQGYLFSRPIPPDGIRTLLGTAWSGSPSASLAGAAACA